MKLVDRHDIEAWANRYDAKGYFPYLVSRLVRATTPQSTFTEFPDGSSVYVGGWDGVVKCEEPTQYVPEGYSLWEFGTGADSEAKADGDYKKRTNDALGHDPSDCTLIIVTPRFWQKKDEWQQEKMKEGIWKNILVYDSRNLEEWLDITKATARWFSVFIDKYPSDGIITIEEAWKEWSIGPKGTLPPEIVTAGREFESGLLLKFLQGTPGIKAIKASSKDEAIAFIIASAIQFTKPDNEVFASKSLIIDSENNFRSIRINTTSLNLIVKFDNPQILFVAASENHHVLVPLGADDTSNQDAITLPNIDRGGQIDALGNMGMSKDDAIKYSKESARNITLLKRLLGFPQNDFEWMDSNNAPDLVPAMLIGRWDGRNRGDRELIEKLTGKQYEDYISSISKWESSEVPPFINIGSSWRLTSPMDAWISLSPFVKEIDMLSLEECFAEVFGQGNPIIELTEEEKKLLGRYSNNETRFSSWVREGVVQSLILIGLYGEGLKISKEYDSQKWVDDLVESLLIEADGGLWVSLDDKMPLIAEASPVSFFKAVSDSLSKEEPTIMKMFEEHESLFSKTSSHTGLLWALEGLAWDPEYFQESVVLLGQLASKDPGGNLVNRPINSLTEIFKPWHFQTLADFDQRMAALVAISEVEKDTCWVILNRMLPEYRGVGQFTHKMRWRLFDRSYDQKYSPVEKIKTYSYVVTLLIKLFDNSERKLADLLENVDRVLTKDFDKVLSFIESILDDVEQNEYVAWHSLRGKLSHHRSCPDADWVLPDKELDRLEDLYNKMTPTDIIKKNTWLFDDHWLGFVEGDKYSKTEGVDRHDYYQKLIDKTREEGLREILENNTIDIVISLSNEVKEPFFLGETLARIINEEKDVLLVLELLGQEDLNRLKFVKGFISKVSSLRELPWVYDIYEKLVKTNITYEDLAQLFVPINQSMELWEYIDSKDDSLRSGYWSSIYPHFYRLPQDHKTYGVKQLIKHKRFLAALDVSTHFIDDISTDLLVEIMENIATVETSEHARLDSYHINSIFKALEERQDIEHKALVRLEWYYASFLSSPGNSRGPKLLHEELAKSPTFFFDILRWVFKPKDEEQFASENEGLSEEQIRNKGENGYRLLSSWKMIPGVSSEGKIDNDFLQSWVTEVRRLAEKGGRIGVADMQIGKILAEYPEDIDEWPPKEICEIIQGIDTDSLKRGFSSATFNKRGSSSRGAFDGGDIERGHAEYFGNMAAKHKTNYPVAAEILKSLSNNYLIDAKRMDESAERDKLDY